MSMQKRIENRMKYYKTTPDHDEIQQQRDNSRFVIRKQKRYEKINKKRNINENPISDNLSQEYLNQLPMLISNLHSNQVDIQIEATRKIRMLLSIEANPPIHKIVFYNGLIEKLLSFFTCYDSPQLQLEAAWCMTNIASDTSGECTKFIVQLGAIQAFLALLNTTTFDEIKEQIIWGLGNIAGENTEFRDLVLQAGALPQLCGQINDNSKLTMLRNSAWALSNLCKGKPLPSMDIISEILVWLCKLIYYDEDHEIMVEALWAFSYLTEGSSEIVSEILLTGVARRITDSLLHTRTSIKIPALRTVGNIVAGKEAHTQLLINVGVLPCLSSLLTFTKYGICKDACWAISNITAGNTDQIDAVINANIIPPLILIMTKSTTFDIKVEAAWSIANICTGGKSHQVQYVVGQGCIKPLCDLLEVSDHTVIDFILDALIGILNVGNELNQDTMIDKNQFAEYIDHAGGLKSILKLSDYDGDIAKKANTILDKYFSKDEEEDTLHNIMTDEATPEIQNQNTFVYDSSINKFHFKF